ncbi:copper resistance CopC family protein [Silvibacterium dinghuense]|uniref:Copper resistance protein CopC n=1 Tax=Silvibacterium dinghuense TaxID=1560006 RepID=A0A4Q1S9L1_9BACT|nr:copper resistance CopC family protein [Silvibacterium dinghuense]RXS93718.1 copper resistance protein CopC [Silvibacterium dinghuense]GGH07107.1 copper resistance protein [Silvibacterium dinghuense]
MMKKTLLSLALVLGCMLAVPRAFAHAVLVSSTPAIHGTAHGPDVEIALKYNSRVDGARSTLTLVKVGGASQALTLEKQPAPEELLAHAKLGVGEYTIRWQAVAADGHITRGEIPFTVK